MIRDKQTVVVRVIDEYTLVLNAGSEQDVKIGDKFLVYFVEPEELKDPITGEGLGRLEIVRGTGSVTHVQEKMCTIKSNRTESGGRIIRRSATASIMGLGLPPVDHSDRVSIPFDDPSVGDCAKPV